MKNVMLILALVFASMTAFAGPKEWKGSLKMIQKRIDLSKSDLVVGTANGAVGAHKLLDLPDEFVIMTVSVNAVTALTGGGDLVVGEDGGGDADGYCLDLDAISADTAIKCEGALIFTSPANATDIGNEKPYKVAAAKDGFSYTIGTTAYTAGILEFTVIGYQGE